MKTGETIMKKLDKDDLMLIEDLTVELMKKYRVSKLEADGAIKKSNLISLLHSMPEQVHHEPINSWVALIGKQMKYMQ